jgi:hypothetical protein
MELEYSKHGGPKQDECWKGTDADGKELLYVRVVAGTALPKPEQPQGCVIVIGETYRAKAPAEFTALAARVGLWRELDRSFGELRKQLKFDTIIIEPGEAYEEALENLNNCPGLSWASSEISVSILEAPKAALGEIGRQKVDAIGRENRLVLGKVRAVLEAVPEQSAVALQCVMNWLLDNKAPYPEPRKPIDYSKAYILGDMPDW